MTQSVLFACLITRRYAGTPLAERCSSYGSDRVRFSGVVERDLSRHNVRRCSKDRRSMVLPRSYKQGHPSFCFSRSGDHATQEHDTVARNISSASGVQHLRRIARSRSAGSPIMATMDRNGFWSLGLNGSPTLAGVPETETTSKKSYGQEGFCLADSLS